MTEELVSDESVEDYLWGKRHEILFRAELSALYHQKRERFFELLDKFGKAISLIGGSAALAKFAGPDLVTIMAVLITSSSAFSLVFSFSDRSKKHGELARNYKALLSEIAAKGERDYNEDDLLRWEAKVLNIETGEPPALTGLVVMCENQIKISRKDYSTVVKMPWWQRLWAHFFDIDRDSIGAKA